jgi:hypothetical protein
MVPLSPSSFSMPSYICALLSFFTLKPEAPPSSTLLFFLKALLGEFVVAFFLFSNIVYISSLVLLTLVGGFYGLSFDTQTNNKIFLQILKQIDRYLSYPPYSP